MFGWSGATPSRTRPHGVGSRSITSTSTVEVAREQRGRRRRTRPGRSRRRRRGEAGRSRATMLRREVSRAGWLRRVELTAFARASEHEAVLDDLLNWRRPAAGGGRGRPARGHPRRWRGDGGSLAGGGGLGGNPMLRMLAADRLRGTARLNGGLQKILVAGFSRPGERARRHSRWVGTGANEPIDAGDVSGRHSTTMSSTEIAQQLGVSERRCSRRPLQRVLPDVVDQVYAGRTAPGGRRARPEVRSPARAGSARRLSASSRSRSRRRARRRAASAPSSTVNEWPQPHDAGRSGCRS